MDFVNAVKKSIGVYFVKDESYDYIEKNVDFTQMCSLALIIYLIPLLIFGLISFIVNLSFFGLFVIIPIIFISAFFSLIFFIGWSGMYWYLFKIFGGQGSLENHAKFGISLNFFAILYFLILFGIIFVLGFLSPSISLIIAIIGYLGYFIWRYVTNIGIFSNLHNLGGFKTAIILLIPLLVIGLFYGGLFIILFTTMSNSMITSHFI